MDHRVSHIAFGAIMFLLAFIPFKMEAVSAAVPYKAPPSAFVELDLLRPENIIIPTAKVNAEIVDIGVTKTNNLDVPSNYYQAGWYKYGPRPGEAGNAVIDGHVDNGGRVSGPFKNLHKVATGDEIYISMSDGSLVTFIVTDASVSSYKKFPGESVFHGTQASVLKIITCHGKYLPFAGTYDQRLIVTAVLKQSNFLTLR